jgi:hypothetical protein
MWRTEAGHLIVRMSLGGFFSAFTRVSAAANLIAIIAGKAKARTAKAAGGHVLDSIDVLDRVMEPMAPTAGRAVIVR